jgi:hypothetical protein
VANTQSRRLNPNFSNVSLYDTDFVSRYESLQVDVQKRLSRGVSLRANYTFSKLEDDFGENHCDGCGAAPVNPFNYHFDWGPSATNLPHVFHFSAVWQLPGVKAKGAASTIVNGWEVTAITSWQSGFPFTIYAGVDNSFSGIDWGSTLADFTGSKIGQANFGSRSHGQMVQQYFNTSLFAVNAAGTFGNSPVNALPAPRLFDTDFAAIKNFKIRENTSVQFRAEFFNIFNNVNFGLPGNLMGTGSFGTLTEAYDPRILQFALKLIF